MEDTHSTIFVIGVLGIISILASAFAMRFKAPLLLVFLCSGMLAGQDGSGGIVFNDFQLSYFLGSLALTIILFNGGLKTERAVSSRRPSGRRSSWRPSGFLSPQRDQRGRQSVVPFVLDAGFADRCRRRADRCRGGGDAAARSGPFKVPFRVAAILEMESGLNDPISVFLMIFAVILSCIRRR